MSVSRLFVILAACSGLALSAEKPSPFVARTSAPAAPAAAPVSPVAPALSILRATRSKPVVAGSFVGPSTTTNSVSPVNRPSLATGRDLAPSPPPAIEKVAPLKTSVLEVPAMVVASIRPPDVSEIEKGMSKGGVVSKLGNPSTVVSMYEDSKFLESLRYEWKGRWLGTVRLVDGRVSRVEQP